MRAERQAGKQAVIPSLGTLTGGPPGLSMARRLAEEDDVSLRQLLLLLLLPMAYVEGPGLGAGGGGVGDR